MYRDNPVIVVRLAETSADVMIQRAEESLQLGKERFYNISPTDSARLQGISDQPHLLLFIVYFSDSDGKRLIRTIYCGTGTKNFKKNLAYQILWKTENQLIIKNFIGFLSLDVKEDFSGGYQIFIDKSSDLTRQVADICEEPYEYKVKSVVYKQRADEANLSPLAQRNQYCKRQYNVAAPSSHRGEFQRDYDRIVHSKAFRRLVDKAQIFTASKGDYYRTRMTHSLIVNQIAKSISLRLRLNPYLTEAIALGHDLGHTPFGHQGERTLLDILNGTIPFPENPLIPSDERGGTPIWEYGGFKHNCQGLRVATWLEEKNLEAPGLDLSVQTLEGILKHTRVRNCDLNEMADSTVIAEMGNDSFAHTLEGQVIAIADEIAQRAHDLDDAFSARLITIDELRNLVDYRHGQELVQRIDAIQSEYEEISRLGRMYTEKEQLLREKVSGTLIDYFVDDVVQTSQTLMDEYGTTLNGKSGVDKRLIRFSQSGEMICLYLEKIISQKVICGLEVSQFDHRGKEVVLGLFRAYYNNPRLLHAGTLRRTYIQFRQAGLQNIIDFEIGQLGCITQEWNNIKNPGKDPEYRLKHKIFVRNICDFIAGMTDSYAIEEYRKIYQP